jgi:hypothetical protein
LEYPVALVLGYLTYLIAITFWDVPYPLQVAGVCLTVTLIYWVGTISGDSNSISQSIILLGKYSLLGYIVQIALLQLLRRSLRHFNLGPLELALSLLWATASTVFIVEITNRARARMTMVNTVYTAVFG